MSVGDNCKCGTHATFNGYGKCLAHVIHRHKKGYITDCTYVTHRHKRMLHYRPQEEIQSLPKDVSSCRKSNNLTGRKTNHYCTHVTQTKKCYITDHRRKFNPSQKMSLHAGNHTSSREGQTVMGNGYHKLELYAVVAVNAKLRYTSRVSESVWICHVSRHEGL